MKKSSYTSKQKLQRLTTAAVLTALSLVLMVTIRFPLFTPFYEMEFADLPLLICSAVLGPVYALVSLLVVCIIQTLTVSASSGIIGFFMHFLSCVPVLRNVLDTVKQVRFFYVFSGKQSNFFHFYAVVIYKDFPDRLPLFYRRFYSKQTGF